MTTTEGGKALTTSYWPADTLSPLLDTTVGGLLREAARLEPDRVALVEGVADPGARRRWTYGELLADAERAARALLAHLEPGDRVAMWGPNSAEWLLVELGAALAGVTLVTVNPGLTPGEVGYVLRQSRAQLVVHADSVRSIPLGPVVEGLAPELADLGGAVSLADWEAFLAGGDPDRALPEVAPEAPAQLQYTSGTTGFPKGALLDHRAVTNVARFTFERSGIREHTVCVNPLPLFHTASCCVLTLGTMARRGTQVLVPAFDPVLVLDLLEQEGADALGGVPTVLLALTSVPGVQGRTLRLETIVGGGAPVPAELIRRIEATLGAPFVNLFGQTELAPVVTMVLPGDSAEDKSHTVGRPLPQVECKVADLATGEPAPVGEQGEFCARGYQVMLGYFEMPEQTAAAIDAGGWLHTGDLCTMDERGYVRVTGRLKDMIIRGGENVYPVEIEEVVFAHPGVAEVAVVGVPDEYWGEVVAGVVRVGEGEAPTSSELVAHCRRRLAAHKVPSRWFRVDAFPLTGSGKVQKFALRERIVAGELPALN